MADDEKKIIQAYNMGRILSMYEPKLLEKIIKANPKNEFVKTLAVAKDHHEFNVGLPKKEFTREYKNGFKNARSLSEHDPATLEKMLTSKDLPDDFKKGLAAGKHEYKVRETMKRMQHERDQREQSRDKGLEI